jgi:hypothetical protein
MPLIEHPPGEASLALAHSDPDIAVKVGGSVTSRYMVKGDARTDSAIPRIRLAVRRAPALDEKQRRVPNCSNKRRHGVLPFPTSIVGATNEREATDDGGRG